MVEQYLNIRLLLKQCPFCLEYLSEKKNKKGENAQKVKKNRLSFTPFTSQKLVFTTFIGKKVTRNQSLVKKLSTKNRDKTIKSQPEAGYDRTYSPNVLGI